MKVGWIGLGAIGKHMARHVLAAGHELTAYARGEGLDMVRAAGAVAESDYAVVANGKDLVALCVFDDAQLRSVLFDQGVLAAMSPGSVLAIHTTGSPALAQEIQQRAPHGVTVLDATFSGSPAQAEAASLTLMVGGPAEALDRVLPAFDSYAQRTFHVGELGQGQVIKLLNNLLFAANLQNAAEVLRMAEQQGIDAFVCADIFQSCSAASFASGLFRAQVPVDTVLGGARPYLAKDVATAFATAAQLGIDTTMLEPTAAYFKK